MISVVVSYPKFSIPLDLVFSFEKKKNKTISTYENEAIIWGLFASEENFIFPLTREKQEYFFLIKGIFEPNVLPIEHTKLNN